MKNILIAICIIVIGFAVGWFIMRPKTMPQLGIFQTNAPATKITLQDTTYNPVEVSVSGIPSQEGETKGGLQTQNVVTKETYVSYKDDGFHNPVTYVKLGKTVLFKNDSSGGLWVASSPHPSHSAYPEFDQKKSVTAGGVYSFTFTKVGSWKFHNHMKPDQTGTIVVQQ